MLRQKGVEFRDFCPRQLIGFAREIAEDKSQNRDKWKQRKGDGRHAHMDGEHDNRIAKDLDDIFKQSYKDRRKQFIDCLRVVGDPRHKLSDRGCIEKSERKAVDVGKYFFPHAIDNFLSHFLQHPGVCGI